MLLAAGTLSKAEAAKKGDKPNILFITTDQQFADVMSCAGSKWVKTPAMDSIAKKGVRFPNAAALHHVYRSFALSA